MGKDRLADLLLLGVQGSGQAGPEQALARRARRIGRTGVARAVTPAGPLVSVWSVRGAPHAHPLGRLDVVRDAMAPRESDDGGRDHAAAVATVAAALTAVVTGPTTKADASTEVTRRVPELAQWCPGCRVDHVPDGLFRAAGGQAQLAVGRTERGATLLHPAPDHPAETVPDARREVLDAFLRVNGPATVTLFREWLGADAAPTWRGRDDLVRVQVGDRRQQLPEALLEDVLGAPEAQGAVLVPPHDPYLRQVDRTVLVPDPARRREVWRAVQPPGALLVAGEVAGVWRHRRAERRLTITTFDGVPRGRRVAAEASARLAAEVLGDDPPAVVWD
jgi:hypothetical protein